MKNWWLIIVFYFTFSACCSAQTHIRIEDKSYANIPLRLYAYDNLVAHSPKLLLEKQVSEKGALDFMVNLKEPQLLYIPIYSFRLVFYAEPNKVLTLKLPPHPKLKEAFTQLKSYANREIPLFITNKSTLNQAIAKYDQSYNDFVKKHFNSIYLKKNAKNFIPKIKELEQGDTTSYFKDYVKYKEAYLFYISDEKSHIIPNYYENKPLQLHNSAYVSLLKNLAKPIAEDFAHAPKYRRLYTKFVAADNYGKLKAIYKGIAETSDSEFNEHFFIYVIYLGITQKTIPQKLALAKLTLIDKNSTQKINQELARSIIRKYSTPFSGTFAPDFTLHATNGKNYNTSILKSDKPTLLAFFDNTTSNTESVNTLHELQNKYNKAFNVILFSVNTEMKAIPKDWLQFVIPLHSYLFQDYHLGRFPYYLLIDANGKVSFQTWQQYLISLEK